MNNIKNTCISEIKPLLSPNEVMRQLPADADIIQQVNAGRQQIKTIIKAKDKRLLAIVGPCSVHDKAAAVEYAAKLKVLADELRNNLCIAMRVYFEKPRTTVGWKGLINDPHLDNSFAINDGLLLARELLLEINKIGIMVATEFVDTITPQYIADLVSWAAIGARTTESQPHRMLASGLSMPVGFKNNTAGDVAAAVNAVLAAAKPHRFLGITPEGRAAIVATTGNDYCHIALRGGSSGPNYDATSVNQAAELLAQRGLITKLMIDCSHDNCGRDYTRQAKVVISICQQLQTGLQTGEQHIMGFMLESNLIEGQQTLQVGVKLNYGQSITDACVGWEETEILLRKIAESCQGNLL